MKNKQAQQKELPKKKQVELKKQLTRKELYVMIKSFDRVKEPFSPLRRKLFSIFLLNRNAFEEVEKFQKELEEKLKEYNQKIYDNAKKFADKDESGELIQTVNPRTGQAIWNFTQEGGDEGLKKHYAIRKEYKKWLDYADPESEYSKFLDEKIEVQYIEIESHEVKRLSGDVLVDSVHILPASLKEKDFSDKVDFEHIRIISEKVKIEM